LLTSEIARILIVKEESMSDAWKIPQALDSSALVETNVFLTHLFLIAALPFWLLALCRVTHTDRIFFPPDLNLIEIVLDGHCYCRQLPSGRKCIGFSTLAQLVRHPLRSMPGKRYAVASLTVLQVGKLSPNSYQIHLFSGGSCKTEITTPSVY
jgi:hypothetical protein